MSVSSFPIACPTPAPGPFVEAQFDVQRRQAAGLLGSGRDIVIDRGIPQWKAVLKTRPLFDAEIGQFRGFRAALRGAGRFFAMWDPLRPYPGAYMPAGPGALTRAGGGGFDGTCALTAIANSGLSGVGRDVISLGTLPVSFALVAGDYVSLAQSGLISLHRILDVGVVHADGGGNATVWVEPEIPAGFTTSAAANLYQPLGKFRMVDFQLPIAAAGRVRPGSASFTALSTLLPG